MGNPRPTPDSRLDPGLLPEFLTALSDRGLLWPSESRGEWGEKRGAHRSCWGRTGNRVGGCRKEEVVPVDVVVATADQLGCHYLNWHYNSLSQSECRRLANSV